MAVLRAPTWLGPEQGRAGANIVFTLFRRLVVLSMCRPDKGGRIRPIAATLNSAQAGPEASQHLATLRRPNLETHRHTGPETRRELHGVPYVSCLRVR